MIYTIHSCDLSKVDYIKKGEFFSFYIASQAGYIKNKIKNKKNKNKERKLN